MKITRSLSRQITIIRSDIATITDISKNKIMENYEVLSREI